MVKINGHELDVHDISVSNYLQDSGYIASRVAVELNGDILPKSKYDVTIIKDGDVLEIVGFVGGG